MRKKNKILFFHYFHGASWPYSSRNEMVGEFPLLKMKFLYYRDYATEPLNTIFTSEQLDKVQELKTKKVRNCWLKYTGSNDSV